MDHPEKMNDIYHPLSGGSIRLLNLLPGDSCDEIHCELKEFVVVKGLQYTALSYAWGSRPADHVIKLNGHRFTIQKNLWRFLHDARKLKFTVNGPFWIDAVCIDQENNDERTQQVQAMPQIYATAREILVWLGPQYASSDIAMNALARASVSHQTKQAFWKTISSPAGAAISEMCYRPYWRRLWIFQEIRLAQRIFLMCGDMVVPWKPFQTFVEQTISAKPNARQVDKLQYHNILASPAASIVKEITATIENFTLWSLMLATRHLQCRDPRDKVYALLGVSARGHEDIRPDYSLGIPTVLNSVLRNAHQIQPPKTLDEVMSQCNELASFLAHDGGKMFEIESHKNAHDTPSLKDMAAFPFSALPSLAPSMPTTGKWSLSLWWASFYGHTYVIRLLFEHGHINARKSLEHAALEGNAAAVKLLIGTEQHGVAGWGGIGGQSLLLAATAGHEDVVQMLLSINEIDLNWADCSGRTALHATVEEGHERITQLLLERQDVKINYKTVNGLTALSMAVRKKHAALVRSLVDYENKTSSFDPNERSKLLEIAAVHGTKDILQVLLNMPEIHADLLYRLAWTAFHAAAATGQAQIVTTLLNLDIINASIGDEKGRTAVQLAAQRGNLQVVRALVNAGAATEGARTAIELATENGHSQVVKLLLEADRSFDVNAVASEGFALGETAAIGDHRPLRRPSRIRAMLLRQSS